MPTWKKLPRHFDALWLVLLAVYILAGVSGVPFHGDESTLIFMGRDYYYLFDEGDLSKILYDDSGSQPADEQHLRLLNGSVSKTIYGWVAHRSGFATDELNEQWHWGRDYDLNRRTGRLPDAQLLNAVRLSSALQLALAVAAFFQVAKLTLNRPTAYLASALFALHPNVLINGRRAIMEGSHLLGLMLVLLAGVWLVHERKWWKYVLVGVCTGFAIAAKHPNVIVCGTIFLAVSLSPIWRLTRDRGPDWRVHVRALARVAAAGLLAMLTFLVLNPAWWSAPLEIPGLVMSMRADLLQRQVDIFGGYSSFATQVHGLFRFVFVGQHQYFEVAHWSAYDVISAQIDAYENSGLAGLLIAGSRLFGLVCLVLATYGALMLARSKSIRSEYKTMLLVWIGGLALVTLIVTPLPWARYYLPLIPALTVLVSHALVTIAPAIWKRVNPQSDGVAVLD